MAITSFTFEPDLIEQFIRFGDDLYRDDSNYLINPANDLEYMMSIRFPFFQQVGNRHQHFLAFRRDRVIGRLTAMINGNLRDADDTPVGTVGFFECEPDYSIAADLLNAAVGWLSKENGIRRVWAPMNFDIWHGYRFMTHGFDQKSFIGEPYNKPYYPEFFACFGFTVKRRWESIELGGRDQLVATTKIGSVRYRRLVSSGHRFVSLKERSFRSGVRTLHQLISDSYRAFLGFTPVSLAEFERLLQSAKPALDPELFVLAYNPSGRPVGFAGAFVEISDALRAMGGRGDLVSAIKFYVHRRRSKRLLFYVIGVVSEEAERGFGLGPALHYSVIRSALDLGYDTMIAALVAIGNRSRSLLGDAPCTGRREYALYELNP